MLSPQKPVKERGIRSRGSNLQPSSSKMQQSSEDQGSGVLSIYEAQSEPNGGIEKADQYAKAISSKTENLKVKISESSGPVLKVTSTIGGRKRGAATINGRSPQKGMRNTGNSNNAIIIQANEVTLTKPLGGQSSAETEPSSNGNGSKRPLVTRKQVGSKNSSTNNV